MQERYLSRSTKRVSGFDATVYDNQGTQGAAIDSRGFDGALATFNVLNINATAITVALQHSDNGSSGWSTIASQTLTPAMGVGNVYTIDCALKALNRKRYLRATLASDGSQVAGVDVLLYGAEDEPVADDGRTTRG